MNEDNYCVCIVTHSKREEVFTNLIKSIRKQINSDIYVAINGDYKKKFDEGYRKRLMTLFTEYDNIYPSFYLQFRGLGKLWNDIVINSGHDSCIVTNDDVVFEDGFFEGFSSLWFNSSNQTILKVGNPTNIPPDIGAAWSTFFINKRFLDKCGYFNEKYLGVGAEDAEFVRRNGDFPAFITSKYKNLGGQKKFTEDLTSEGASCVHKYHSFNYQRYNTENDGTINFRPFEKYFLDHYDTFWKNT